MAALIWLGQRVHIRVRLEGVGTPELRGQCDAEREFAVRARDLVAARTAGLAREYEGGKRMEVRADSVDNYIPFLLLYKLYFIYNNNRSLIFTYFNYNWTPI